MMMKTPAITNQYGEMNTGMPNGRAMRIPGPDSRRWGGFSAVAGGSSGVVLATLPMLRAVRIVRVDARGQRVGPGGDPSKCRGLALRWRCGGNSVGRGDDPPRPPRFWGGSTPPDPPGPRGAVAI